MTTSIENAQVSYTLLGPEDHGIFTFTIGVKGDSWGCGFGCMSVGDVGLAKVIQRILAVTGAPSWEKVPGSLVRVETEGWGGGIVRIGHIMKNEWFSTKEAGAILRGEGPK